MYSGSSDLAKLRLNALAATVYTLWNARNRVIFDGEKAFTHDLIRRIKITVLRCMPVNDLRVP